MLPELPGLGLAHDAGRRVAITAAALVLPVGPQEKSEEEGEQLQVVFGSLLQFLDTLVIFSVYILNNIIQSFLDIVTITLRQKYDILTILTLNFVTGHKEIESLLPCDHYWTL